MPVRFAVANGNWNTGATWDNGSVPVAGDTVHPSGFTVTIDTDISINSLNNNFSPVYLPNMPIPKMTGNTQPSGTVNAGSDTNNAWKAFDQESTPTVPTTFWAGTGVAAVNSTAWLSYQFTFTKTIKRYYFFRKSENPKPTSWVFQGSNNGTNWDDLETVTSNSLTTPYLSGILPNITAYLYYRINVTAVTLGTTANIYQFEMTESTATTYGTTGGSFTVPSTLSGIRNIEFTGAGLMGAIFAGAAILTLDNNLTNTVNLNKTSGAYIINPLYNITDAASTVAININNNGIVNFNGDLYGTTTAGIGNASGIIRVVSNATITVNGNLYPIVGRSNVATYLFNFLSTSTNSILNINGDVIGGNLYSNTYALFIQSVNTVNIIGNLTSNAGYCYYSTTASFLNLTGSANLTNVNSVPSVLMTSTTSLFTMNGAIINKGNVMAASIQKMRYVSTATPYWIFQTNGASDMTLTYGSAIGEFPAESDVRTGVQYAAAPIRTGTCAVPLPQYVSQGVATGSTVGTAYLNAADVWNILTSTITAPGSVGKLISDNLNETVSSRASQTSVDTANTNINNLPGNTADAVWNEATSGITTAGSIGERLKNASTVQTNGDQLAAYIV